MGTHIFIDSYPHTYYFINMKTTVEINDVLINQLKQNAHEKNTTMKELMEKAILLYLDQQKKLKGQYKFKNNSFKGNGVCEGVEEGAWEKIRSEIYEGRGG